MSSPIASKLQTPSSLPGLTSLNSTSMPPERAPSTASKADIQAYSITSSARARRLGGIGLNQCRTLLCDEIKKVATHCVSVAQKLINASHTN
jgi:hypothetical protein